MKTTPHQAYYSAAYNNPAVIRQNEITGRAIRRKLHDVPYNKANRILDVACGAGYFGTLFGGRVWGFDSSREAVRAAKKNGITATVADAEKPWKYQDKFFDIVILSHIIEHVRDPDAMILEARRVLKPDGTLIALTPNLAAWYNRVLLLLGYQPFFTEVSTVDKTLGLKFTKKFSRNMGPVGHLRLFTPGALGDLLSLHSFTVIQTIGMEFGSFPVWLGWADRLVSRSPALASSIGVVARKKSQPLTAKKTSYTVRRIYTWKP